MENNSDKMPKGIPYVIGNELAERFSYYGMRTILFTFMTEYLMDMSGLPAHMSPEDGKFWYHLFQSANYFLPIIGAVIADTLWGKYKTIILLSLVYCCGHLALTLNETRLGLSLGLTMIAIGSGGIKPCVSALVGDQFGKNNFHLIDKVYNLFYLAINIGATFSMILTPYLLKNYGPSLAFGVPGGLMLLATLIFWLGREKYISAPPVTFKHYIRDLKNPEVQQAIMGLAGLYCLIAVFWSLYEQTGSAWVAQSKSIYVNKNINLGFKTIEIIGDQIQSINGPLVILFVPLFAFGLYPFLNRFFELTPLKKISIGLFITALSFVVMAWAETQIQNKIEVSIGWQALAYVVLTAAEVMVYGTGLAFSYSQAPPSMKSLIMGMYMLSISLGNLITAFVNYYIKNADGTSKLPGASYYWFFVGMMVLTAIVFIFVAKNYKEKTYVQEN
jgi:POT family proton-dependent oligopeptide transporter